MGGGDCFVVSSPDGLYWTGQGWSSKAEEAQAFTGPPDPYAACAQAVSHLEGFGHLCDVVYLPARFVRRPPKIPVAQSPGPDPVELPGPQLLIPTLATT